MLTRDAPRTRARILGRWSFSSRWIMGSRTRATTATVTPTSPARNTISATALAISRIRFVLRAASLVISLALLAMSAVPLLAYCKTHQLNLMFAGSPVWPGATEDYTPKPLQLTGSRLLLSAGVLGGVGSVAVLIAGAVWVRFRRVGLPGDAVAGVLGAVVLAVALAGAIIAPKEDGLLSWSCMNVAVTHPQVDLAGVCAEMQGAVGMAWALALAETLGWAVVTAGWVFGMRDLKRDGKEAF